MIQLTSRAGNRSCATAGASSAPAPAEAATPRAALPAVVRTSRRLTSEFRLILDLRFGILEGSVRRRQPQAEPFFQRTFIQEMCQRNVLRHQARGVDQDPLVVVFPAGLLPGHQLVD